jgi:predicted nuclease of predicted toxin-antitoxin system
MTIKVLVDMNLSPEWVSTLTDEGWEAVHWSAVGDPRAPDTEIMAWALAHDYVVFTHDLNFGTALALTHSAGPSVLQIRGRHVLPERVAPLIVTTLRRYEEQLKTGALVVVEESRSRIRVLPIKHA